MAMEPRAEATGENLPAPEDKERVHVDPAVRRGWKIGLGGVALVAAAILLWYTAQVLLVFFFAIFLSVFFSGLAQGIQRRSHFSYRGSLAFVLLALVSVFGIAGMIIGPAVADQSANLSLALPKAFYQLVGQIGTVPGGTHLVDAARQALNGSQEGNFQNALKFAGVGLHGFGGVIFAIVIGIFLAGHPELYRNGFLALFPRQRRQRMGEVLDELGFTLWWWLLAQLATMASVGILVGIGLTLLGVPLSGTLGLLAALLSFIPSLGPFISVIPAAMLGLTISPTMGLWVCLLYLGVQTLEANVITPLIQQRAISLPPALILGSELLMGLLLGGAGLAFATPLAAVVLVLVNMLYIQDILHEPGNLPSRARAQNGRHDRLASESAD
jgi:predicted PurR-regulated permease PerM